MASREKDEISGTETTGHEWDGIKELNTPLPRWWIMTFYATIVWALGYTILYPAWPLVTEATPGVLGYSSRADVAAEIAGAQSAQAQWLEKIRSASLEEIVKDQDLLQFARAGGAAAFKVNCIQCHGSGAAGSPGYPNLNDDDWLWGGKIADLHQTISGGVRSDHKETRASQMPRYGLDKLLDDPQIEDAAEYVLALSGQTADAAAAARGEKIFAEQCATCHNPDGKGKQEQGAPNLTDKIWLYGGTRPAIVESIRTGRGGMMPAWAGRLDPVTIKSLAVYVHSLGGGK